MQIDFSLMTYQDMVRAGEAHLREGPHPERARRDAETLLLHVIRRDRATLIVSWDKVLDAEDGARFAALVRRRKVGEPIQYILGETEFYGLPFTVTPDVLIPRPETEHLVERVIELAANFPDPRVLDVGTGSGAIAIALAHHLPKAVITVIDLSAPALAIARQNALRNDVNTRMRFLHGDLFAPVAGEAFDIVVSNLPYVSSADRASLSVEVRDYEPALALFDDPNPGSDGLEIYRRFTPAAFQALTPGGLLAIEFGYGQAHSVAKLLSSAKFRSIEIFPDLQGIPRVAFAWRP
jgi:release factor glutamine methyltransferase